MKDGEQALRLDKFLKVSRIIKRRTVANDACDAGRVTANDKIARASYDVKVGDVIEISLGQRPLKIRVLEVKEHVTKDGATELYEILDGWVGEPRLRFVFSAYECEIAAVSFDTAAIVATPFHTRQTLALIRNTWYNVVLFIGTF